MKRRKRNESVSWFPGVDPEAAMSADAALQDATHDLLRALLAAFPQLDPAALSGVIGKAEKTLAAGLADLLAPEAPPPADDTQFADPDADSTDDGEFHPEENLARRVLRQCGEAADTLYNWVQIQAVLRKFFSPAVEAQMRAKLFPSGQQRSPSGADIEAALGELNIPPAGVSNFMAHLEAQ